MIYKAGTPEGAAVKVVDLQGNVIGFAFEADTDTKTLKCYVRDPSKPDTHMLISDHKLATVELKRSYDVIDRNTGKVLHEVRVDFNEQCGEAKFEA